MRASRSTLAAALLCALGACAAGEFAPAGFDRGPERALAGVVTEICFDAPLDLTERGAKAVLSGYALQGEATATGARYADEAAFVILGYQERDGRRVHQCTVAASGADLRDAERVVAAVAEERALALGEPTDSAGYSIRRFDDAALGTGALMVREGLVAEDGFEDAASITVMREAPL